MASSSNDIYHHLNFVEKVETYRRKLIKSLNDKMAYGGSKTGEWDWKVGNDFYKSVEDFRYPFVSIQSIVKNYLLDIVSLLFWTVLVTLLLVFSKQKHL